MKSLFAVLTVALFLAFRLSVPSQAQIETSMAPNGSQAAPDTLSFALTGKVQVEGGADPIRDTSVVLECGDKVRASSNVDSHGQFSLILNGTRDPDHGWNNSEIADPTLANCRVYAQAPGYRSTAASLAGEHGKGIVQVGTLVLAPLSTAKIVAEDFTVSVASLAAPDKAKQQFEKGKEQEKKGKWAAAADYFRKAIQVYPRYAIAWLELGRTQIQQNNFAEAQDSLRQAATHDSKLLPAYFELARIQAEQKEWKALSETTGKMVQLAPDWSPMLWFLDAAANYNLHELARAESSATRGLRLDTTHRVPQLEYLYGLILGAREDYSAAVKHIRSYLQLVPNPVDGQNAQKALSEFESLASKAPTTAQRQ